MDAYAIAWAVLIWSAGAWSYLIPNVAQSHVFYLWGNNRNYLFNLSNKKRMKNLFTSLLIGLLLISCNKDDEKTKGQLIGKWNYTGMSATVVVDNQNFAEIITEDITAPNIPVMPSRNISSDNDYYIFTKDGKFGNYSAADDEIEWHTYSVEGNILSVYINDSYEGAVVDKTPFSLNGNIFILHTDETQYYKDKYPEAGVRKAIRNDEYLKDLDYR